MDRRGSDARSRASASAAVASAIAASVVASVIRPLELYGQQLGRDGDPPIGNATHADGVTVVARSHLRIHVSTPCQERVGEAFNTSQPLTPAKLPGVA